MDCENLDLSSIVTPIKVKELTQLLNDSGYDRSKSHFLIKGFSEGFDLGYEGPKKRQDLSRNLPFHVGNETDLWNKIMKEIDQK